MNYLVLKGLTNDLKIFNEKDLELWNTHLATTEFLLKKHGVVFTQGIPDPWRNWPRKKKFKSIKSKEKNRTGLSSSCWRFS